MSSDSDLANLSIIYLARHGQTFGNVERVIKDPTKDSLTKTGEDQAQQLGNHLSDVKFTRIYCSNFLRAIQTTDIVKEKFQNAPVVIYDSRIREVEDRSFINQPYTAKNLYWGKGIDENHPLYEYAEFHTDTCESVDEIFARQDSFFEELFGQLDKSDVSETVFILSHGVIIRFIMKYFTLSDKYELQGQGIDEEAPSALEGLRNCSYHKFQISKRRKDDIDKSNPRIVKLLQVHHTDHLRNP